MSVGFNVLPSLRATVAGVIPAKAQTAGAETSTWVSMETYDSILAIIDAGTPGSSGTIDGKLQQATDASGTSKKDITGKAITQLTAAGYATIDCYAYELDRANGFTHVAIIMTVGTATSPTAALILGLDAKVQPPTPV